MNELEVRKVPFMGTELMAARDNEGQIWAGVRWMCDGIGLTKGQMQNERNRIREDKVLSKGERNLVLPTNGGQQNTLCLKLDYVPLWLAKIAITPRMERETRDWRRGWSSTSSGPRMCWRLLSCHKPSNRTLRTHL